MKLPILKKATLAFLLLSGTTAFGQCPSGESELYITSSGTSYPEEKWINVTTDTAGAGTVIYEQGNPYGTNAGLLTDEPFCVTNGVTVFINAYDAYADDWDGTVYSVEDAGGTVVANNGGVSPDDGTDTDTDGATFGDPALELETSESFTYTPPSCPTPGSVSLSGVTATDATVNWVENGSATSWFVSYGTPGFTPVSDGSTLVGANPTTISGLTASTDYEVFVRALCAPGDTSSWSSVVSFTTPCDAYTPDYSENFDAYLPNCWEEMEGPLDGLLTGTSSNWFGGNLGNIGTTTAAENNLYTNTTGQWLISPSIDLGTGNGYQLEFGVAATVYNNAGTAAAFEASDTLAVVISTDNGATWMSANILQIWEQGSEPSAAGDNIIIDLSTYSGVIKIGFYAVASTATASDFDVSIDNFKVRTPPSCVDPNALSVANITSSSAEVSWMENGSATLWAVEYDTTNFTQGSGVNGIEVATNPYTISGLDANATYDFYVTAVCAPGDSSAWVGPFTFTTACNTITPQYLEEFTADPSCWSFAGNGDVASGPTDLGASNWTLSSYLNDLGATDGMKMNLFSNVDQEWLLSPIFDFSTDGPYELLIDAGVTAYNSGSDESMGTDDRVDVLVSTDAGASWVALQSWDASNQPDAQGESIVLDLTAYTGTDVRFAIYATDGATDDLEDIDFHIGSFEIRNIPTCPMPTILNATNVLATTAELGWMENGSATQWEVEYDVTGFTLGNGINDDAVTTNPYMISGLTPVETYDFYVRAICGPADSSIWEGPYSFTTPCATVIPAYLEEFTVDPACWNFAGNGDITAGPTDLGSSDWTLTDYLNDGGADDAMTINLWQNVDQEWMLSPVFDMSTGGPYELKIDAGVTDYNDPAAGVMGSDDHVDILVSTDAGASWVVLQTWDASNQPAETGESVILDLTTYTGADVRFAIYGTDGAIDDTEDYDFHIGSFEIRDLSAVGINEDARNLNLLAYPNPNNGSFFLRTAVNVNNAIITVLDLQGKVVYTESANLVAKNAKTINISTITPGMYFVNVKSTEGTYNQTIVIK